MRNIGNVPRWALAAATLAGTGAVTAGCDFLPGDPHLNPEAKIQMQNVLQPEAQRIGRVIFNTISNDRTFFYGGDGSVPGGHEITVDFRDDEYEFTLTANMLLKPNGDFDPSTTYHATIEGSHCANGSCGDTDWKLTFDASDTFYSKKQSRDIELPVWYGQEDLYALWDTTEQIKEDDSHLKSPSEAITSKDFKKSLAEAEYLKRQAEIAINAALLDPAFAYGQISPDQPNSDQQPSTTPPANTQNT